MFVKICLLVDFCGEALEPYTYSKFQQPKVRAHSYQSVSESLVELFIPEKFNWLQNGAEVPIILNPLECKN